MPLRARASSRGASPPQAASGTPPLGCVEDDVNEANLRDPRQLSVCHEISNGIDPRHQSGRPEAVLRDQIDVGQDTVSPRMDRRGQACDESARVPLRHRQRIILWEATVGTIVEVKEGMNLLCTVSTPNVLGGQVHEARA